MLKLHIVFFSQLSNNDIPNNLYQNKSNIFKKMMDFCNYKT